MNWTIFFALMTLMRILNPYSHAGQDMKLLEVKNNDLKGILSSFIQHEKRCTYYDPDLTIIIQFESFDSLELIQIEATKKVTLFGNELGGGIFLSHEFIVRGETIGDFFEVVKGTAFKYHTYVDNTTLNQTKIEDDSFTIWVCDYSEGLKIIDKQTYCNVTHR